MTLEELARIASANNVKIAENGQRIYDSGWLKGESQGWEGGWQQGYENGAYEGEIIGKERFWEAIQAGGTRTNYSYAFSYWGDVDFTPAYIIRPVNAAYMFLGSKISRLENAPLDFSQATQMTYAFSSCAVEAIEPSISTVSATDLSALFGWNGSIRRINEIVLKDDGSQSVRYMFENCRNLETVQFRGAFGQDISFGQSSRLTQPSISSIVTALSDAASGKTLTLSRAAVDAAWEFGTSESGWLDLVASKPNWTISLV